MSWGGHAPTIESSTARSRLRRRLSGLWAGARRPRGNGAPPRAVRRALVRFGEDVRLEVLPFPSVSDQVDAVAVGSRVTVTCSPQRGVDATVDVAMQLTARGYEVVPHLAARQVVGRSHLDEIGDRLTRAGVRDVFVVGGDAAQPAGPYPDGVSLLEAMDGLGYRFPRVGTPAYPEGHRHIPEDALWQALVAKQPYCSYMVTQVCFDAGAIFRWIATARDRGVALPVYVGVPGLIDVATLLRVSARAGVGDSLRFARSNRRMLTRLVRPGRYRPDALLSDLGGPARGGRVDVAGLHVFTLNRIESTVRYLQAAGWAAPEALVDP